MEPILIRRGQGRLPKKVLFDLVLKDVKNPQEEKGGRFFQTEGGACAQELGKGRAHDVGEQCQGQCESGSEQTAR